MLKDATRTNGGVVMHMDMRKLWVLDAIVESYIDTGEPASSKLVAKMLGSQFSSATIRNEMSALFDMGLLEQPHTSAGRIPSHLGFRVYIDRIMNCKELQQGEKDEIDALFNIKDPDPDKLLADSAKALAEYTGCAAISSVFTPVSAYIKRIEIIPAGGHSLVLLLMASNGVIRQKIIRVEFSVTPEVVSFFVKLVKDRLTGRLLSDVTSSSLGSIAVALGDYAKIFTPILAGIYDLCREINDGQVYTGGFTNILGNDESSQIALDILSLLEHKERMLSLLSETSDSGVTVSIGRENTDVELMGSSLVLCGYHYGEQERGVIGVLGPVRIDYARLIPHIEYFAQTLGKLLSETLEETKEGPGKEPGRPE